jgi:hypothetical protein
VASETARVVRFHTLGVPEVLKFKKNQSPSRGKAKFA